MFLTSASVITDACVLHKNKRIDVLLWVFKKSSEYGHFLRSDYDRDILYFFEINIDDFV